MKNINIIIAFFLAIFVAQNADAQKDTLKLNMDMVSGAPGEQVCVDVTVKNFVEIEGVEILINFNPAKLQYISTVKGTLNDLDIINDIKTPALVNSTGQYKLAYVHVGGKTLPDGSVAFSICFVIKGAVGDKDDLIINPKPEYSTVSSGGTSYQAIAPNSTIKFIAQKQLKVTFDKVKSKVGEVVCVPVRVFDLKKTKTAQFDINWDNTKLKFDNFSGVNTQFAPNGATSPFYKPINPTSGIIKIDWNALLVKMI
jgi:Cohesin domain